MHILIATDQWFPDLRGGVARVAAETGRRLADRGHEVTVIAPRSATAPLETREGRLVVRRVLGRSGLPRTFTDPVSTWLAARREELQRFDLVVAHVSTTAIGLVAAKLPVPLAYVFHASASRELQDLRRRSPGPRVRAAGYILGPLLSWYERVGVRGATRVLVLSEFSRSLLEADHPGSASRVRLVSGGVDVGLFTPGEGMSEARAGLGVGIEIPLLLTVRRLEPRMGLEQLLRAFASLSDMPHLELAVAGEGSLDGSLRALAGELGIGGRVRFLGRASEPDLRNWYRAADLFVLPTQAYEGFGMVTAEALASGTPVIGTPIGATPELLEPLERRLVTGSPNSEDLAAAVRTGLALSNAAFRQRCREYACARFSWDVVIGSWERALEDARGA